MKPNTDLVDFKNASKWSKESAFYENLQGTNNFPEQGICFLMYIGVGMESRRQKVRDNRLEFNIYFFVYSKKMAHLKSDLLYSSSCKILSNKDFKNISSWETAGGGLHYWGPLPKYKVLWNTEIFP